MSIVLFILAGLCLLYFGVIVFYSGITTSFCGVWVVLAVLLVLMGFFIRYAKKHRGSMPNRVHIFVYTTFGLAAVLGAIILATVLGSARRTDREGCDYCIVLGDTVYTDSISTTLKYRLERAVQYAKDDPHTVFVLSGGKEDGDAVPEALSMYDYMVKNGVSEDRLLIETASLSTAEKIRNSVAVIDEDMKKRMIPPPIVTGILTSDYNIHRAMVIASSGTGMDIFSIRADSDPILFPHQCVRECAAVFKDFMTGVM